MSQSEMVSAILADTKAHGFEFVTETVKQDGRPYPAEIVKPLDLAKFDAAFPGVALEHLNGSSTRVGSQALSRNARGKMKPAQLREANVKWLLGIEAPTKREVFVGPEGVDYDTREEAEAAWVDFAEKLQNA